MNEAANKKAVADGKLQDLASRVEFAARKLANGVLIGAGRSVRHGFGFDFDQLRPYQRGDDVRFVDWRASSRSSSLLVRQYFQERSRIIGILYDCSGSMSFSTAVESKQFVAAQTAALIAIIAERNADQVAAVGYADRPVWSLPRAKGKKQTRRLIEHVVMPIRTVRSTQISGAMQTLCSMSKQRMLVFVVSDCIEPNMHNVLATLQSRHEVVVLRILDARERSIENVGLLTIEDFETGQQLLIDTSAGADKASVVAAFVKQQERDFLRYGIDVGTITATQDSLKQVAGFLMNRVVR